MTAAERVRETRFTLMLYTHAHAQENIVKIWTVTMGQYVTAL
jgi:hypothetical protein